tara:strand:- start:534 stop:1139 length:606 start_codon:yes stop_codon:yes gene_type:complete
MDKESNTWKEILKMTKDEGKKMDDAVILRNLGVDESMLESLEGQVLDSAKEKIKIEVKFTNHSNNKNPEYKYLDDSGVDLRAYVEDTLIINPGEIKLIPTGLHFELPESMEIQVRPRSGLAAKNGITVLNTPGTVDRGYTGEIKVILINLGKEKFIINNGDRIAQAVVSPVVSGRWCKLIQTSNITQTNRSDGGFGSTGIN